MGLDLQSIRSGSLEITVAVHDTYALEKLMENHRSGKVILELAKIFATESKVERFCRSWSSNIDENMYTAVLSKLKPVGQSHQLISEWDRNRVREWLSMELCLKEEIANQVYEQEYIGQNLLIDKHDKIFKEFKLKKTDLRMIQYSLEEKRKDLPEGKEDSWKTVTNDCSATRVSELLFQAGLPPIHAEKFANMDMTGVKFLKYREEHFVEDFNLTSGPLLLVLHMQNISQVPQTLSSDAEIRESSKVLHGAVSKSNIQNEKDVEEFGPSPNTDIAISDSSTNVKSPTAGIKKEDATSEESINNIEINTQQKEEQKIENTELKSKCFKESLGTRPTFADNSASNIDSQSEGCDNRGDGEERESQSGLGGKTGNSLLYSVATDKTIKSTQLGTDRKELQTGIGAIAKVPKSIQSNKQEYDTRDKHVFKENKSSKKKKKKRVTTTDISDYSEAEHKIRELLLEDSQLKTTFDIVYDAILVIDVPGTKIPNVDKTFEFISKVKWKAVFDFDANSNKSGICKSMRSKQEVNLYGITDIAKVTSPSEINYAEVPTWVFCNGRSDIDVSQMDRMSWIEKRSQAMDKAVEFFSNTCIIRQDSGLVIFILLPNNIEVLSEAFRKFYTDFGIHRIIFICEQRQVFDQWCKQVRRYCHQEKLEERLVVVPFHIFNDIILRMQGVNLKSDYMLPTVNGKRCNLLEKDKSKWVDLSVIAYNECDNTDMNKEHPDFETFCKDTELNFYRGEKLSFWNFKFDHVCQRDVKYSMVEAIENEIKQPTQPVKTLGQAVFHWFHLFHQPGAGGSTVVKHILWEFRQRYRCILLNKITDQTEAQILDMWNYGERDYNGKRVCLPLVIVSDNIFYDDLTAMVVSLEYSTKHIPGRTCIILNCKRYMSKGDIKEDKYGNKEKAFFLEHSLSDKEKKWFQAKHDQLERRMKSDDDKDFKPDRLLAFMVMKEDFQSEYVEHTVGRVLDDLKEQHPQEFELVRFCSLFSKFERDSAIPIPCCDEFIGFAFSVKKGRECPWEHNISDGCSLLMSTVNINELGAVQGLKIVHPIVADFILRVDANSVSLSSLVTHFLKSKLLTAKSYSRKYLAAQTHDLLIKRNQTGFLSFVKQPFSALILAIKDVDKEYACYVLIEGFHILQDPMIAQQVARYYSMIIEDHSKALEYIEIAIGMRGNNSFLLDTKGQIYKNELIKAFYNKYVVKNELLGIDDSCKLLQLAFNGIDTFHKSQEIDDNKSMSTFSGEVDITFKMLDVLACLDVFKQTPAGRNILQRYLVDKDYKPDVLAKWAEHHMKMKGLMRNVHKAIDTMNNHLTYQKEWSNFTKLDESFKLQRLIASYLCSWDTHFGCIDLDKEIKVSVETANDLRRLKARKLIGTSGRKLFEMETEKLLEIRKLLLENNPYSAFDLKIIIQTNLALSTITNVKKSQYSLPSVTEMIDLAKEFYQCDRQEGSFTLFAPVYLLMLLWPRGQPADEYDNSLMKKSLLETRRRWNLLLRQDKQEDGHLVYGPHLKSQRIRKRPLVHFFLGNGKGLRALVHQTKISSSQIRLEKDQVWHSAYVKENLLKVEGTLSETNNIIFKHDYMDESIQFPLASSSNITFASREEVVFYIGFSWGGPVAYYVKPKAASHLPEPMTYRQTHDEWRPSAFSRTEKQVVHQISVDEYHKKRKDLNKKVIEIEALKMKVRQGKKLEQNQEAKLRREHDFKQQMKKLEDDFKKQIDMEEI
ncbi:sterile alpha motif domain-containing protein 9-like [Antedon mediterranea]|uniref:sterile alpha motif domain-containing protein 9-like n=1 Tax=Antedon mediterranea TaxID=105859 RepID=UPI003AF99530